MVVGTVGTQDRGRRRDLQESAPQDVLVARQPIVGMLQDDAERILGEMLGASPASAVDVVPPARWTAASVRHYLHVGEGDGYWDFYKPWT